MKVQVATLKIEARMVTSRHKWRGRVIVIDCVIFVLLAAARGPASALKVTESPEQRHQSITTDEEHFSLGHNDKQHATHSDERGAEADPTEPRRLNELDADWPTESRHGDPGKLKPLQALSGIKSHLTGGANWQSFRKSSGDKEAASTELSPVILVPGYGGSRLEARRNKTLVKHYFCQRVSDWSNIWIELKLMLPYMIDCLIEDFRLEFGPKTNLTHNTEGIEIRVRNPDDVANVEFLTDIHLSSFGYFAPIIRRLVVSLGYQRNHNLLGAPYDFRKAPNELVEFFAKLKRDSENLVEQFNGRRVTYICHSMGCNNILYFLQRQSLQWKERHVLRVISLAAPWGGSMQAVRATVFGDNLGLPYLFDEAQLKIVQKSVPSTMYLYPKKRAFGDSPLISFHEPQINTSAGDSSETLLTATDFKRLFEKIQHPNGYLMWLNTRELLGFLEAPQVELHCLYGRGRPTLGRMQFQGDLPDSPEEDLNDDGDGTVTTQSSTFCKQWAKEQSMPVHTKAFHVGHVDILRDGEVLDAIEDILTNNEV